MARGDTLVYGKVKTIANELRMKHLQPGQGEWPRYLWVEAHVPEGARVLDIGCNSGVVLKQLHGRRGVTGVGIDMDADHIEFARSYNPESALAFRVMAGEYAAEEFAPGSFDAVLALEVIEHVPKLRPFLTAIYTVLKPDGVLVTTTPLPHGEGGYKYLWTHPQHLRVFSQWRMDTVMQGVGFQRTDYGEVDKEPFGAFFMCCAWEKGWR